ncbi:hypothetical protein ACFFQF_17620 [Haladaptatus pallidirubidus]|uniref:Uncharacterized protein n=1 Tax=Haladaptatus pallidirubidus TaxID=1008152 RepID=A0AAV3URB7_9EURY
MNSIEWIFDAAGCVLFGEDDVPHEDALVSVAEVTAVNYLSLKATDTADNFSATRRGQQGYRWSFSVH